MLLRPRCTPGRRALFEDLDQALWRQTRSNPRLMLRCVSQQILDEAAADESYLQRYRDVGIKQSVDAR